MAQVELRHVWKRFGEIVAVEDFSLAAVDGEFVVFVGPSGCGKTTTMRIVAGLEAASQGEVFFDGQDVTDQLPHDRDVAMVFQNYALFPHLNVYSNIAFGMRLRKVPKAEIEDRVRKTARLLGIESVLERRPKELSGGQRQRVALGRAIVREPRVFLMDEPLSKSRRRAAHGDARGNHQAARKAWRDHVLCHARSDRGSQHGRSHRCHARREDPAGGKPD